MQIFIRKRVHVLIFFLVHFLSAPEELLSQPVDSALLLKLKAPNQYHVSIKTDFGKMILEANKSWAPLVADRFYQLVVSGFYNNTRAYRDMSRYFPFTILKENVNAIKNNSFPVIWK